MAWLQTAAAVIFWYSCNMTLLMTNKYLVGEAFRFPIFLTFCHMVLSCGMSNVCIMAGIAPAQQIQSRKQFINVGVLSLSFGGSILMGVSCLKYIPVSFDQAICSTTPAFTALLVYLYYRKRESGPTYGALVLVVGGIMVASNGEPLWNLTGFLLSLFSTVARAFKGLLQQVLMADDNEKLDAMNLLRYMTLVSAVLMFPAALAWEGWDNIMNVINHEIEKGNSKFFLFLSINVSAAFFANLCQFLVTKYTGALTMMVLGNAKNVIAAIVSILVFKNPITMKSAGGYAITTAGVFAYTFFKQGLQAKQAKEVTSRTSPV
mmetsp:Transcript_34689/g.109533  ORF Transcript_34689/g.109533 Transcript_34689/m.109533 type:complete len:319 (+) Transcript_34689:150-1106(+)|eukprot:CAMPEP_0182866478 /NCGR_PEP_ID=MMETSP0034_2-20130328/8224_1 /TAXON_ID=156128 /ORGANISM="Nephroselmis pyriformis, Strain CCMP717" /LENGTH=318 /DNA_ID=CAMNT_0024998805 /DNA_START=191 /DNA_END=1147 /DNA_ORIENTATION=-